MLRPPGPRRATGETDPLAVLGVIPMRRVLVAALLVAMSALFPASALADAPYRVYINSGGSSALANQAASACLGSEGRFYREFTTVSADGRSTMFAHTSDTTLQARVHGTLPARFWTSFGDQDAPHVYDGSIELRVNDVVRPMPGFADPPQGYVAHPVVIDMVPVAGGPSVLVASEIQIWVVWNPDGTISVIPGMGLLACA